MQILRELHNFVVRTDKISYNTNIRTVQSGMSGKICAALHEMKNKKEEVTHHEKKNWIIDKRR